ncbi:MAG: signal peptidase II [Nitrospirae bacterium]|nr:signal peptidase II [Nitrospirota bacterium]
MRLRPLGVVIALAASVFACDQVTKKSVQRNMEHLSATPVVSCCLNLTHVHNRGGAFGMFSETRTRWGRLAFTASSFLALGFLLYLLAVAPAEARFQRVALSIILGGAVGNLYDRMVQGFVVDFVDAHWRHYHWPAFNVADMAITVGILAILGEMVLQKRSPKAAG